MKWYDLLGRLYYLIFLKAVFHKFYLLHSWIFVPYAGWAAIFFQFFSTLFIQGIDISISNICKNLETLATWIISIFTSKIRKYIWVLLNYFLEMPLFWDTTCLLEFSISFSIFLIATSAKEKIFLTFGFSFNCNPLDTDVFKTSSGCLKKVTTS